MSTEDADSFDEEDYEKLTEELNLQFPDAPFTIDFFFKNVNDLCELDEPFTSEPFIFICDGRIHKYNYYYSNCTEKEINELYDYLLIKSESIEKPITLRQILNEMIKSPHYNNKCVREDDHHNLVGFDKRNENSIQYYASFEN
jgi:hypothetical protein